MFAWAGASSTAQLCHSENVDAVNGKLARYFFATTVKLIYLNATILGCHVVASSVERLRKGGNNTRGGLLHLPGWRGGMGHV